MLFGSEKVIFNANFFNVRNVKFSLADQSDKNCGNGVKKKKKFRESLMYE